MRANEPTAGACEKSHARLRLRLLPALAILWTLVTATRHFA
jgi:hypothetical protein